MSAVLETTCILIDVLGMVGSGMYYNTQIKGTENTPLEPNFFMKCLFPGCTLCLHQGWDNTNDVVGVCCFGPIFTVLCWEPKNAKGSKVYVIAE